MAYAVWTTYWWQNYNPMSKPLSKAHNSDQPQRDVSQAALAWAEYLYDEYMNMKHKQLLLSEQSPTIDSKETN